MFFCIFNYLKMSVMQHGRPDRH